MGDICEAGDSLDIKTRQGHIFTIILDDIYENEEDDVIIIDWSTVSRKDGDGITVI